MVDRLYREYRELLYQFAAVSGWESLYRRRGDIEAAFDLAGHKEYIRPELRAAKRAYVQAKRAAER
jgi:hypothetical protein